MFFLLFVCSMDVFKRTSFWVNLQIIVVVFALHSFFTSLSPLLAVNSPRREKPRGLEKQTQSLKEEEDR